MFYLEADIVLGDDLKKFFISAAFENCKIVSKNSDNRLVLKNN
jgi:hypothetical protein